MLSGKYLDLHNPQPDQFDWDDIIIGMAREPRWSNQSRATITVGLHTLFCYDRYPSFETLIHDAPEGLIKDMPKPLKDMMPGYVDLEERVYDAICRKANWPNNRIMRVKQVDEEVLEYEWENYVNHQLITTSHWEVPERDVIGKLRILFRNHLEMKKSTVWN